MRGIMFSTQFGMHQAVIAGTKTRTRRIFNESARSYRVGEVLYVKEPYCLRMQFDHLNPRNVPKTENNVHYSLDGVSLRSDVQFGRERNKMFMPEKLARYFIEITSKQCCLLQDITGEECIKEGIQFADFFPDSRTKEGTPRRCYMLYHTKPPQIHGNTTPINSYKSLWERINGKGSWEENPMVWDYEFKLITKESA